MLLAPPASVAAEPVAKQVDLDVRLDPPAQTLYAKATVTLHNRGGEPVRVIKLEFPAEVGPRIQVNAVWDRRGEMEWRSDPAEAEDEPRALLIATRTALRPGEKLVVVVGFDLHVGRVAAADPAILLADESARLRSTGWYPLPAAARPVVPLRLRLTVRLPKAWQVSAPVRLRPLRGGTVLAGYELDWKDVQPGVVLFEAWPRSPR